MIDINKMRRLALDGDLAAMQEIILRLEAAESECLEQARLNGMGGEREAALMAKLEAAEKSDAESLTMYRKARDERDALRAALRHEADCVEAAKAEIEALRAKIEATEQQEPARLVTPTAYRWRYRGAVMWQYGELTEETARRAKEHNHEVQPLYALPGAQPAPSVPDAWKLVPIEPTEAMVTAFAELFNVRDQKNTFGPAFRAALAAAPEAKP